MRRSFFIAIVLAAGLLFNTAASACACPVMKRAEPKVGSTVQVSPQEIRLYFSGPVLAEGSRIEVLDSQGTNESEGQPYHGTNESMLAVKLHAQLPDGRYKVIWSVHCNCGGTTPTVIPGDFSFSLRNTK